MSCMKCLSKCFCPKKLVLPQKIPSCASVISNLTFHPNFHSNILIFVNLPIYRKLIHDNISLVFWKPKPFCLVLFWRRDKIVCTYKHLHYKLWLVLLWRRYVLFLVINIGIIISVSVILKKIKFILTPIYLHCCNIPEGYSSNSSHNFHVDSPFKIDVISTNFPRGFSTSIRWRIGEDVSIGQKCYIKKVVLK